jgi:PIN domain nuclease of toxin-antitoxin system
VKYLLDTMVWLWSVGPSKIIGTAGLEIIARAEEDIYLSAASSWEIAIKARFGKFRVPEPPARYVPKRLAAQGIRSLPINQDHSLRVYDLPPHHSDPSDRMIIAQAMK